MLGGVVWNGNDWGTHDADNAPENQIVSASPIQSSASNFPNNAQRGMLWTHKHGYTKWQEFYELGGNISRTIIAIHYRNNVNGTWYEWMKLTLS